MKPERQLVRTLLYLHQQLERAAVDQPMNMSQYFLLHFLHEEPRRASDFTVVSRLRKPGVTSMVTKMEEHGWIERAPDPDDGRAQIIRITKSGYNAFLDFEKAMQDALEEFLGQDAVQETDELLNTFYQVWNERRINRFNQWKEGKQS